MRRVVVTGLGAVSPLGLSAKESFSRLIAGEGAAAPLEDAERLPVQIACRVPAFDAAARFGRLDADHMDRFAHFAVYAAEAAWEDAAVSGVYAPERVASVMGSGLGGVSSIVEAYRALTERGARWVPPFTVPKILPSIGAGWVSIRLGLKGPNLAPATACAAGAHAILEAAEQIARGAADAAVCGGAEAPISPLGVAAFAAMRALSRAASRPFDLRRDGFVLGEGGAALVLEEAERARGRGARIYAELSGWGATGDAFHLTAPDKDGAGCARAMRAALERAGAAPGEIGYVNAHATGTAAGDAAEALAVRAVLGDAPLLASTKGATGHLLGAAGALEAVFTVLSLVEGVVPPTAGLEEPDPACPGRHVLREAARVGLDAALSNSMGFGGTNAALLFRRVSR
jgi:3-oxoacyl-[acyl-carrier-protein] synthase II